MWRTIQISVARRDRAKRCEQGAVIELFHDLDPCRYGVDGRPHRIERCGERVYE
jgi:hypothetical protein